VVNSVLSAVFTVCNERYYKQSVCAYVMYLMTAAKFVLFIVCRRVATPSAQVLAIDHRNDVISNTVAVACGIIGIGLMSL